MAFTIVYSIEDEKSKLSTLEVNLPSATAWNDVVIFAAEMAKLIEPLKTGAITRVGIAYTIEMAALAGAIAAAAAIGSDVEEGAAFAFKTANNFFTRLRIPTFDEAKINQGSRDVDLTDPDVATFLAAMTAGIDLVPAGGSGTVQPSDKREEDITTLSDAKERFQSS